MSPTGAAIAERAEVLRTKVRHHKQAIRAHKEQLHAAAAELTELEAHAKRLGLGLYLQPGVGGSHGRNRSDS